MTAAFEHDFFISYDDADRGWVEGVLLDALTAAGIRCYTEAEFDPGLPTLLAFERAVRDSRRTLLVLSPDYLGDARNEFVEVLAHSYGLETATWPVTLLMLSEVSLPPRLMMLNCLEAIDAESQAAAIARLCQDAQRPAPGPPLRPPCPYPGMAPFREADHDRFFGREEVVQTLVECLRLHPFLTVIGPSGCGKSSLVFAGLIPRLRSSSLFGPGEWLVRSVRPGVQPLLALTAALGGELSDPAVTVQGLLNDSPEATRLLIVVDQFEETFTIGTVDTVAFQEALLRLSDLAGCYVVLTVRADFYADLMRSPLWPEIQAHRVEVLPLTDHSLQQAITRPAEGVGVFVETALVERLVLDAAGEPGSLPLVQETLVLLWDRLERRYLPLSAYEALVLPHGVYRTDETRRTGLQVAMARRADAALAELSPEEQAIARRIFIRLVQFSDGRANTRRQQPVAALRVAGDDRSLFDHTLGNLTAARLLTLSGVERGEGARVDLAHEALISGWPTLQTWLEEQHEAELTRRRLDLKADEWVRLGRGVGGLLDEAELPEAEHWLASPAAAILGPGSDLTALVHASRAALERAAAEREAAHQQEIDSARALAAAEQQRAEAQQRAARRLRYAAVALTILLAFTGAAAALAVGQSRRANEERRIADERRVYAETQERRAEDQANLATSRWLVTQALDRLDDQPDLGLLLSLAALDKRNTPEARGSLLSGLLAPIPVIRYLPGHDGDVYAVAFDPTRSRFASAGRDGVVVVRNIDNTDAITFPPVGGVNGVRSLAFDREGRRLAAGGANGEIIVWDLADGRMTQHVLLGHRSSVRALAFSPVSAELASGSMDRTIAFWDTTLPDPLFQSSPQETFAIWGIAYTPDGGALVTANADGSISLWDTQRHVLRKVLRAEEPPPGQNPKPVWSVAVSSDGRHIAAGSGDRSVALWDARTEEFLGKLPAVHRDEVLSVAFSRDGSLLVSTGKGGQMVFWDVAARRALRNTAANDRDVLTVAVSSDGGHMATGSEDGGIVLWNTAGRRSLGRALTGTAREARGVAFNPVDRTLASVSPDGSLRLWRGGSADAVEELLIAHTAELRGVAFNRQGTLLAAGGVDGTILVWNAGQPGPPRSLFTAQGAVQSLVFASDGVTLAVGDAFGDITLWDTGHGVSLGALPHQHRAEVRSMDISPDGRILASGGADFRVQLWDLGNRRHLLELPLMLMQPVNAVAFSPDGSLLAVGPVDGNVILWEMTSARAATLSKRARVTSLAFSTDRSTETLLAVGDADNGVTLWDIGSRQVLGRPLTDADTVWSIAFSGDGAIMATGAKSGGVTIWDMDVRSWREQACVVAGRNLREDDEWPRYMPGETYRKICPKQP